MVAYQKGTGINKLFDVINFFCNMHDILITTWITNKYLKLLVYSLSTVTKQNI